MARIAEGWANRTLADLRADLVEQYLALRMAPAAPAVPAAPLTPVATPSVARETSTTAPIGIAESPRDVYGAGVGAARRAVPPPPPAAGSVPPAPPFACRAFLPAQ